MPKISGGMRTDISESPNRLIQQNMAKRYRGGWRS